MTRKREVEDLEKVTLNLYKGDFHILQELHPRIGGAKVIRILVRNYLQKVREKSNEKI